MPSLRSRVTNVLLRTFMKRSIQHFDNPLQLRGRMAKMDAMAKIPRGFSVREEELNGVPAHWLSGPNSKKERIMLHFHGGGFATRSPNVHARPLASLAKPLGATGLLPLYRLAPENPYPAAVEDCFATYRWLLDQGHSAQNITFSGDSAGGCLALVVLARAREEGLPLPSCAVLMSPSTDVTLSGASVEKNKDNDPVATRSGLDLVVKSYLNGADPSHPHISPLFGDFTGFPPLLFQVGDTEMLLDDSTRAAEKALAAGVQVTCEIWEKMPHVFQAFEFLPESRQAIRNIVEFARLHTGWPRLY